MFARLFILLGLLSSISLGAVAGLLWLNSASLEEQLRHKNEVAGIEIQNIGEDLLVDNLTRTHTIIVSQKAKRLQSFFDNIAEAVQLEATLASQFLSDEGSPKSAPPLFEANQLTHRAKGKPSLAQTLIRVQPYSIYHLAPKVSLRKTEKSMNRLRRLGTFFSHIQHSVSGCDSTYLGSEEGFIQGYPGGETFFKPIYDPRKRPWYLGVVNSGKPANFFNWQIDPDRDGKTLYLTCARAITLSGKKNLVGVAAMDVQTSSIVDELFDFGTLNVSQAVLVENTGKTRVSAKYDPLNPTAKPIFDTQVALTTPSVSSIPGFNKAWTYICSNPKDGSGIYIENKNIRKADYVYLYAKVNLPESANTISKTTDQLSPNIWCYIVQLPAKTPKTQPFKIGAKPQSPPKSQKTSKAQTKPTTTPTPQKSLFQIVDDMQGSMEESTKAISTDIKISTDNLKIIVLVVIAVTLLIALFVAYIAARATSRPLIQMAKVARGVGQGNLDQEAIETAGGEIGEMGRAINAMISGLRQRNLLQDTFSRYTAPSVVEEVLKRGGVQLGGVKSVATIFFSDLVGFTSLSEQTEPEILVALLNEYFDAMTKAILETEGTLDKYIGDAILAFWGHPIAHDDDATRACRTALAQRRELYRLCDKWEKQGYPRLDMRIGIETGEVIVGDIGSELKLNYTVLGDTVNLASRLESLNKTYGTRILIGETTRRLAGDSIAVREIDLLAVMGKSRPVHVYELLGMAETLSPIQISAYAAYDRALRAYHARQWDEAEAHLLRVERELGPDKPCQVMHKRIEQFRLTPPPPDWDGSSVLTSK